MPDDDQSLPQQRTGSAAQPYAPPQPLTLRINGADHQLAV